MGNKSVVFLDLCLSSQINRDPDSTFPWDPVMFRHWESEKEIDFERRKSLNSISKLKAIKTYLCSKNLEACLSTWTFSNFTLIQSPFAVDDWKSNGCVVVKYTRFYKPFSFSPSLSLRHTHENENEARKTDLFLKKRKKYI